MGQDLVRCWIDCREEAGRLRALARREAILGFTLGLVLIPVLLASIKVFPSDALHEAYIGLELPFLRRLLEHLVFYVWAS